MTPQLLESWLVLQCQAIPGVRVGYARFRLSDSEESSASWPARSAPDTELHDMLSMARRSRGPGVAQTPGPVARDALVWRIARPILVQDQVAGAIVIELDRNNAEQQDAVMRLLQWGNTWLELLSRSADGSAEVDELSGALRLVLNAESLQQAAMAVVGYLAHRLDFERVSLGLRQRGGLKILALSDSAEIGPASELAMTILTRMHAVVGPAATADTAQAEAPRVAKEPGLLTVALHARGDAIGALTCETQAGGSVPDATAQRAVRIAELLGPLLDLQRARETAIHRQIAQRITARLQSLSQPRPLLRALAKLAGVVLLAVYLLSPTTHRVSGAAELQGAIQRALIAPFDGYIATAHARAGERIDAGFVLAELDDRELRLEYRQLAGDRTELDKQYRKALAALDHAQARILQAQIDQASARIDLLAQQLERIRLTAPFAGVVVEGDLSRALGKPVERGEVLFEIAPLHAYRVAIEVADRDISVVQPGQTGQLILAAIPNRPLPVEVTNVSRMVGGAVEPGTFRVEARLQVSVDVLRPGMRGVAKLAVGQRSRGWIWTHELVDWLRYRLWAWLP